MIQKETTVLLNARYDAWNRYCENVWSTNDTLRQSFEGGFNEGLNWVHKELIWILSANSNKELIDRIHKVQTDIETYNNI